MDEQTGYNTQAYRQPVESASGTTSSENKSGPTAYIVSIIAVLAIIAICVGMTRCTGKFITGIIDTVINEGFGRYEYMISPDNIERIINDDDIDADTFEEYFEQIFGEDYNDYFDGYNGRTPDGNEMETYKFNSHEVLMLDIAIYEYTIDSMLSASAYAGSDADVKEFVREVVLTDRTAADDLVHEFRRANRDGEDFAEHLDTAREIAAAALNEISFTEIPESKDETQTYLEEGVMHASARWSAIIEFIDLLRDNEEIPDQDLEDVDDTIYYETRNAATAFENALTASKN